MDPLEIRCPTCRVAAGCGCRSKSGGPCGRRIQDSADALEVKCPDCHSSVGEPCRGVRRGKRQELAKPHAHRTRLAREEKGIKHGVTLGRLVAEARLGGARRG